MIYPCPSKIDCPGSDFPIENYSAEDPEVQRWCAIGAYTASGPLGCPIVDTATVKACSFVSYQDALLAAYESAKAEVVAALNAAGCPLPTYCNTEQSCSINCPDGTSVTYTVAEGMIFAESQEAADAQAYSYACQRATGELICLGDLPEFCCLNHPYSASIVASGAGLSLPPEDNLWELLGVLPTGLTFNGGYLPRDHATITGTPTDGTPTTFVVKVTSASGMTAVKTYTLGAFAIDWTGASPAYAPLPSGNVGTSYLVDLIFPATLPSPAIWSVTGGALPPGLALNPITGLLSGTPTLAGTFNFTIGLVSA